eukprot:scaffold155275_cov66-Cyclotella_meneghiniana.AAC.1
MEQGAGSRTRNQITFYLRLTPYYLLYLYPRDGHKSSMKTHVQEFKRSNRGLCTREMRTSKFHTIWRDCFPPSLVIGNFGTANFRY